jgi:hypothetical protein
MNARALENPRTSGLTVVKYLDLVVLVLALPVFLVAGLPIAAWGATAAVWLLQRWIDVLLRRRAQRANELKTTMGLVTASMIGRAWLLALTIFAVGIGISDEAGLSAAVLAILLMTVYFTTSMIVRPFERGGDPS